MPDLTLAEVKVRLKSYSDPAVTDELYSSGESLVTNAIDRMTKLDNKGWALAAYSGGILTILISTYALWGKLLSGWLFHTMAELAILAVAVSAWLAVKSAHPQSIQWHTENSWLESQCIKNREKLRRYRVLTMWKILDSYFIAIRIKNRRMKWSLRVMYIAFFLLFICFFKITGFITLFQHLCIWIR
jgi:hypothetical protein